MVRSSDGDVAPTVPFGLIELGDSDVDRWGVFGAGSDMAKAYRRHGEMTNCKGRPRIGNNTNLLLFQRRWSYDMERNHYEAVEEIARPGQEAVAMSCRTCPLSCRWFFACVAAGVCAAPISAYSDWFGDFLISVSPSTPTALQTFDLQVLQVFGDPSQERVEQSITFDGNRLHVYVLMKDLFGIFPQVVTADGAFFDDIGPLAAGTYRVDAEMWMRRPTVSGVDETILINSGSLTFDVTPAPLAGDFNQDGVVNAADFVVWRKNSTAASDGGSGADELVFDTTDYDTWRANFGRAAAEASGVANSSAVPEPASAVAVLILLLLVCLRATRRRGIM
jgi:hypothetical protein